MDVWPDLTPMPSCCRRNIIIGCCTKPASRKSTLKDFTDKRTEVLRSSSKLENPNGPPPSKPTTPKPQSAISRLKLEPTLPGTKLDFESSLENTTDTDDEWSFESNGMKTTRRYSCIPRQRCYHASNLNQSLADSTTTASSKISYKCSRFTSTSSLRHVHSPRIGFERNSPARIATHRRRRKTTENHRPGETDCTTTDIIFLSKYQKTGILSPFKQNEIPLRNVE